MHLKTLQVAKKKSRGRDVRSKLASRFVDTVRMISKNQIQNGDNEIELMPILRDAMLNSRQSRTKNVS